MKTTKLHTLEELLTNGITIDGNTKPIKVSCIFIPKIQRSYAQGRKTENDIRTDFITDIFDTLTNSDNKPLELSFFFGSKQKLINGTADGFELLDGQQRATTLYLLYWYAHARESAEMPDFLSRFTYETRDTSSDFLSKISSRTPCLGDQKPSDVLRANKWFTDDYYCDPTICAMLNMLDDIHEKCNLLKLTDMVSKLNKLKFYVLLLEKFDMNDELYIKMNSRGLSLIPFENFKASVVRYMKQHPQKIYGDDKVECGKTPYWLEFTSSIDAKWIDIFWQNPTSSDTSSVAGEITINDREIGNRYFRFLNRYFFTKAAILKGVENKKLNALANYFYKDCESPEAELRLKGWDKYEELFLLIENAQNGSYLPATKYPVFSAIERILNIYLEHKEYILECIKADPYCNTSNFDVLEKDKYTLADRVAFAAMTEFIESLPDGYDFSLAVVQDNFKRMFRIVHNVIENTLIENDVAVVGVINSINEIIHFQGATNESFYLSLARNEVKSRNSQLKDEKEKAQEMFGDDDVFIQSWEDVFKVAEGHPFFKGSVTFFFTPKVGNSNDFKKRYNVVKELFDVNGIAEDYRSSKQHILIRAMLACLNHWDKKGLQDRYFTENVEKEKYLKSLVTGSEEVRAMFCNYFNDASIYPNIPINDYLKSVLSKTSYDVNESNNNFKMLYDRLLKDDTFSPAIFDDVAEHEKEKGCFRIMNNRSYVIMIPGKWYYQLVLDTERNLIIPDIIKNFGFEYCDKQHCSHMQKINDTWGWPVSIEKILDINGQKYTISLTFNEYKNVDYYVYGDNVEALEEFFGIINNTLKEGIKMPYYVPYRFYKDRGPITDKISEIEQKLRSL